MGKIYDTDKKMVGSAIKIELADRFLDYCKSNDFKIRSVFTNLIKWWLELDETIQWLIYRGMFLEAHKQIAVHFVEKMCASGESPQVWDDQNFRNWIQKILEEAQKIPADKKRGKKAKPSKAG